MMKTLPNLTALLTLVCFALPSFAQDQDLSTATDEAQRQARIQELRQLLQEDRAERRQAIQAQLDTMTEEQKAALQERRQMQRQARNARQGRTGQRRGNSCDCSEITADEPAI